jgi:uncharacterized delta-60 repeat protein
MKKFTSTLTMALLCLYTSAQVGALEGSFNTTGTPPGFVTSDLVPNDDDYGTAVSSHKDGRVVVAAFNADASLGKVFTLFRYTTTGVLDPSFGLGTGKIAIQKTSQDDAIAYAVKVLSDNTILAAGTSWNASGGGFDFVVAKFNEDGSLFTSFGTGGWAIVTVGAGNARDEAHTIAVQPDGKIVLAGTTNNGTDDDYAVVRLNANGTLDATGPGFGTGGKVITPINGDDEPSAVAIQSDGKIVVGGTSNVGAGDITVVRYNADGSLDATGPGFGTGGIATIDGRFNNTAGSNDLGNALAIQADGKIVITGQSSPAGGGNGDLITIRLTTAGVLDPAFNPTGAFGSIATPGIIGYNHGPTNSDEGARAVTIQSNGKILIGGDTDGQGAQSFALLLLRYNDDGSLDNSFNTDGIATIDATANGDFVYGMSLVGTRIYLTGPANVTVGNKDFFVAAVQNDAVALPLVLSSFYAQKQTSKVVLQWQTSSEEGVKQFVIERSNDGKTYKTIGTVAATGSSSLTKNYSFPDLSPYMSASNYYRLLMQDQDGNYKYSKILIIKFDGQLTTSLSVFPNPTKDLLQVQLPDGMTGTVGLQVIDLNGRVVRLANLASDGNALNTTIDVSTLVKGVYVLKAQAGNVTVSRRFIKK